MKKIISIVIACFFCSCIQEYMPQGIDEVSGILVIDGMIRDGESVFKLSYSVGISDTLNGSTAINNVEVYVESNDGTRIPALFSGNDTYIAQTPVLDVTKKYRLSALIDGEICESEFLTPIITARIDSIFPVIRDHDNSVEICVSTHDPDNSSIYYRWKYRETWEVKAELFAQGRYWEDEYGRVIDQSQIIPHHPFTSENTYYCWGRDSSKTFVLASTEKLSENRIAQQPLVNIPREHDKLSILYYIEVEQSQIRVDAYQYFDDLKKSVERTGGIFDPILTTGIRGNIYFRNDPERMVIGYIEVATVSSMGRYIWEIEGFYQPYPRKCSHYSFGLGSANSYYIWERNILGIQAAYYTDEGRADKRCVDCRTKEKATKLKPPGWPTDHL